MKTIDEREFQKTTRKTQTKTEIFRRFCGFYNNYAINICPRQLL